MSIIEEIYNADILHISRTDHAGGEYQKLLSSIVSAEDELYEKFPEAAEMLKKYQDIESEFYSICHRIDFVNGFKIGAQLVLEMIKPVE